MQGLAACPCASTDLLLLSASKGASRAGCAPGSMLRRLQRTAHSTLLRSYARIIIYMCWHKVITNGAEQHAQPLQAVPEETLGGTEQSALSVYQIPHFLPPQSFPLLPQDQLFHGRGVSVTSFGSILLLLPAQSEVVLRGCKLPCYSR